jgi:hypothetical protein
MSTVARFAAAAIMAGTSFGLANVASPAPLVTSAHADNPPPWPPWPFVGYHWCPGLPFDPAWGPQWDPTTCHDAHHRDRDGVVKDGDYWGPSPFQTWPEIPNTRP